MPPKNPERPLLFLDACCIINLFATGLIEEILASLPYRLATSRLVATREVLSIARIASPPDGPLEREVISPARLENTENLAVLDLVTDAERADFIRFTAEIDDGEASVCALAVAHQGGVATDDRRALRVLGRIAPRVPTVQTPELFHDWARLTRAPERTVKDVLRAVRLRARFYPRRDAPCFEWWERYFR
ncbi:MAG: hypothetical protein QOJ16_210 [Acidobacteriota bacterium]|jgi:hypothetical protein|nr:hypothetical protein [Acidobacteriota bacterium]